MQTRMELHIRSLATAPHTSMQTEAVKRGSRSQEDRESQTRCSLGFQSQSLQECKLRWQHNALPWHRNNNNH